VIDAPLPEYSSPAFFDAKYYEKGDPWNFSSDAYELARYTQIVASLTGRRYRHAFEPGCSIGVLTERLAEHCDSVTACDFSAPAVRQAAARCSPFPWVRIQCASITDRWDESFDLLIFSEIGYYFSSTEWKAVSWLLMDRLSPGSIVIAAHWLGSSEHHRISGDTVHEVLLSHPGFSVDFSSRSSAMRLERLTRL
jgi:cyclopropane fatty-acyl-phospholipid synthase-like methyltransferase